MMWTWRACGRQWRYRPARKFRLLVVASVALVLLALAFGGGMTKLRQGLRRWWLRAGARSFGKHRPGRNRFEQDLVGLLKRLPPDPLMAGAALKAAPPKGLQHMRASAYTGPLLLTAPHGIPFWRGEKLKGSEPGTTSVAWRTAFMDPLRGFSTALTWRDIAFVTEVSRSKSVRILDPNYLLPEETLTEPWSVILRAHYRKHGDEAILVDIHGMAGGHGSDCTIGVAPWNATHPKDATACQQCIQSRLSAAFPSFRFRQLPYFTGDWEDRRSSKYASANDGRMTLSKQSVHLGMRAVQLEMTMALRNAILGANGAAADSAKQRASGWTPGKLLEFSDTLRVCVLNMPSALQTTSSSNAAGNTPRA